MTTMAAATIITMMMVAMVPAAALAAPPDGPDDDYHSYDRGTCTMYVHGTTLYDHTDDLGNPRHNPDRTLYPNDMASFRFTYSFGENCINPYVGRVQDEPGDAILVAGSWGLQDEHVSPGSSGSVSGDLLVIPGAANACHGAPPEGGGGPDGYSSDFGVPRYCGDVSLTISAYTWMCIPDVGCYKVRIRDTARVAPPVVAPIVIVNTTRHMLLDPEGYPAANLDLTHYPWDPVAIEHGVVFEHRDDRSGTITFRYDRSHPGLAGEGGFSCDSPCSRDLRPPGDPAGTGFLPYPGSYGNGGGIHAYTAPSMDSLGRRTISYTVTVENMGIPINSNRNHTEVMVVRYDPVFEHHPYTVLADGHRRAYDDRQGLAIRYDGSIGSGPDDDGLLHPDRRAKITNFHPVTVARSASTLVEPMVLDPALLSWNSTWAPPHTGGYHQARQEFAGRVAGSGVLPDHPFHSTSEGGCPASGLSGRPVGGCHHLMFVHAAHGAVRFSQEISGVILVDNAHRWYDNITTTNGMASDGWAGHPSNVVLNYTYTYPHTELANSFRITPYGDDGEGMAAGVPLRVAAVPHVITHDQHSDFAVPPGPSTRMGIMLDQYILAKVSRDTGDQTIAEMAASETYGMVQEVEGAGRMAVSLNKTALEFWTGALRASGYGSLMEMPVHEALEHEATTTFVLEAGDHSRNLTIPYGYDTGYHERVYLGDGMTPEVRRTGPGTAEFAVPYQFGIVSGVTVSPGTDMPLDDECHENPCSIAVGREEMIITIRNAWGGTATSTIPPYDGAAAAGDPSDHLDQLAAVAPPLAALVLAGVVAGRVLKAAFAPGEPP